MSAVINPLLAHSQDEKLETSKNNEDNMSKMVEMSNENTYSHSDAGCLFSVQDRQLFMLRCTYFLNLLMMCYPHPSWHLF